MRRGRGWAHDKEFLPIVGSGSGYLHIYPKCVYIYSSAFPETGARFRFVWRNFGHTAGFWEEPGADREIHATADLEAGATTGL